jgi:hypothetical protein
MKRRNESSPEERGRFIQIPLMGSRLSNLLCPFILRWINKKKIKTRDNFLRNMGRKYFLNNESAYKGSLIFPQVRNSEFTKID